MARFQATLELTHQNLELLARLTVPQESHGSSEVPTQRTGEPSAYERAFAENQRSIREHEFDIRSRYFIGDPPDNPFRSRPDASPAEPAGEAGSGAVPPGGEPGRAD